jgi:hypothetical protein
MRRACAAPPPPHARLMFAVDEDPAEAIRRAFNEDGEWSAAVELRREAHQPLTETLVDIWFSTSAAASKLCKQLSALRAALLAHRVKHVRACGAVHGRITSSARSARHANLNVRRHIPGLLPFGAAGFLQRNCKASLKDGVGGNLCPTELRR